VTWPLWSLLAGAMSVLAQPINAASANPPAQKSHTYGN
jgi:hypothetical protein